MTEKLSEGDVERLVSALRACAADFTTVSEVALTREELVAWSENPTTRELLKRVTLAREALNSVYGGFR